MKITCQSCQSKYNVADEKVQGKVVKIRCKKCGATIVVNGTDGAAVTNGAAPEAAPAGASSGDGQWHVNVSDTDQRSMSLAEIVEAYNAGTITQETFIWTDGMDDWKPLAEVDSVVSALHSNAGAAAPAPAPAPALAFEPPPAASPVFAASAPVQAAAAAPEPKRAAVKREARGRDLFGTSDDVQTSATASPAGAAGLSPAVDDGKLTGQRNESSVLFSLAVLTKSGDQPTASAQPTRNKEDSGLIDLKALAAKAESMRPTAPAHAHHDAFASPLGSAPLPLGSPLGAVTPSGDEVQPKSKLPLILGGAFGALVLIVLSVVVTVKLVGSGAPAPSASAAASSAPSATAADTASASAAAAASTPPPAASASASATVATKGGKPGPGGVTPHGTPGGKTPATTGATPSAAATTPPVVVKKSGGDCGCNGDLMCLMQCSTKH